MVETSLAHLGSEKSGAIRLGRLQGKMNRLFSPLWIVAIAALLIGGYSEAKPTRDGSVIHQFRKANPCPETGKIRGACPGWEIDHKVPLCAGGRDEAGNLQWLRSAEHREKTRKDVRVCAESRRVRKLDS